MADAGGWARRVLAGRPGWMANVTAAGAMALSDAVETGARPQVRVPQRKAREPERAEDVGEARMVRTAGGSDATARGAWRPGSAGEEGVARGRVISAAAGRWAERVARPAMGGESAVDRRLRIAAEAQRAMGAVTVRPAETPVVAEGVRRCGRGLESEREQAREERRMRVAVAR